MPRVFLAFLLTATAMDLVDSKEPALSPDDISRITRICRRVVGYPVIKQNDLWSKLTSFLRTKSELDHFIVDCSSQHCSGSIRLRDDSEVIYTSIHVPPEHSNIASGDLTPDIEYKGNNRLAGVALVRRGKVLFKEGELPRWLISQHNQ